jgi:Zn-finger nucleic acid-binding protein
MEDKSLTQLYPDSKMSLQPLTPPLIVCDFCHQSFTRQGDANRHYNTQHNRLLDAVCPICYGTWISGARVDKQMDHMRSHHPELPVRQQWIPGWIVPFLPGIPSAALSSSSSTPLSSQDGNNLYYQAYLATIGGKHTPKIPGSILDCI